MLFFPKTLWLEAIHFNQKLSCLCESRAPGKVTSLALVDTRGRRLTDPPAVVFRLLPLILTGSKRHLLHILVPFHCLKCIFLILQIFKLHESKDKVHFLHKYIPSSYPGVWQHSRSEKQSVD